MSVWRRNRAFEHSQFANKFTNIFQHPFHSENNFVKGCLLQLQMQRGVSQSARVGTIQELTGED